MGESTELPLCLHLGVRRQIRESILVTYGVNNLVPESIPGGDAHTTRRNVQDGSFDGPLKLAKLTQDLSSSKVGSRTDSYQGLHKESTE